MRTPLNVDPPIYWTVALGLKQSTFKSIVSNALNPDPSIIRNPFAEAGTFYNRN